jgi:hypothetical protein
MHESSQLLNTNCNRTIEELGYKMELLFITHESPQSPNANCNRTIKELGHKMGFAVYYTRISEA